MWFYIAGCLKIKVISHRKLPFGTKSSCLIIKGGCKIEGLLYVNIGIHQKLVVFPDRWFLVTVVSMQVSLYIP